MKKIIDKLQKLLISLNEKNQIENQKYETKTLNISHFEKCI